MSVNENDWLLCSSPEDFELKATEMIANYANDAIAKKGYFSLVLAGGNTPKKIYNSFSKKGEAYRKRRMAAGEKSSAYLSGSAVKVCKGQISGRKKKK